MFCILSLSLMGLGKRKPGLVSSPGQKTCSRDFQTISSQRRALVGMVVPKAEQASSLHLWVSAKVLPLSACPGLGPLPPRPPTMGM